MISRQNEPLPLRLLDCDDFHIQPQPARPRRRSLISLDVQVVHVTASLPFGRPATFRRHQANIPDICLDSLQLYKENAPKTMKAVLAILLLIFPAVAFADVADEVANAIRAGNAKEVSKYFADNVDLKA